MGAPGPFRVKNGRWLCRGNRCQGDRVPRGFSFSLPGPLTQHVPVLAAEPLVFRAVLTLFGPDFLDGVNEVGTEECASVLACLCSLNWPSWYVCETDRKCDPRLLIGRGLLIPGNRENQKNSGSIHFSGNTTRLLMEENHTGHDRNM